MTIKSMHIKSASVYFRLYKKSDTYGNGRFGHPSIIADFSTEENALEFLKSKGVTKKVGSEYKYEVCPENTMDDIRFFICQIGSIPFDPE